MKKSKKFSQKPKAHKLWTPYLFAILCLLLLLVGWFLLGRKRQPQDNSPRHQVEMLGSGLAPHVQPKTIWYAPSFATLQPQGADLRNNTVQWLVGRWREIYARLRAYQDPDLQVLADEFQQSQPAAVTGGLWPHPIFRVLSLTQVALTAQEASSRLKIVFFGPTQLKVDLLGLSGVGISYYREDNSLYMPALVNAEPVMIDAMAFHELKHELQTRQKLAFADRNNLPLIISPDNEYTDTGADDELEAHQIGRRVFDLATRGAYSQAVRKVVSSKKTAQSPMQLILQATPADYGDIDKVLGRPVVEEVGHRVFQFSLDLGREWIAQHVPEPDQQVAMRNFFR